MALSHRELVVDSGWTVRRDRRRPAGNLAAGRADAPLAATVPGLVQQDLLSHGVIPDPFVGDNEAQVQWVGDEDWIYECRFDVEEDMLAAPCIDLCLDGLDTVVTVTLNGTVVHRADNMFVPVRVPVAHLLRPGRNELVLHFASALRLGRAREQEWGPRAVWNGDSSRVYVRKAQYHYGWDWGPALLTAGPYRPVRIEAYRARIADIACPVTLADDHRQAVVDVTVELAGSHEGARLRLDLFGPDGELVASDVGTDLGDDRYVHRFRIGNPRLWWPRGHGEQARYTLRTQLCSGAGGAWGVVPPRGTVELIHERALRLGVRTVELAQVPVDAEIGTSFGLVVNGRRIYCAGANWIPADSLLTNTGGDRYDRLVELAAAANMTMLRVWGGGIYEEDRFYDRCDEAGILVWQDFMFACGIYPAHEDFVRSVRAEARAAVTRLRHHPSVALWCGNNEDYMKAEELGVYRAGDPITDKFPARVIYEKLLPEVCAELDPGTPYWPGSPYGGETTADQRAGNRHAWDLDPAPGYDSYRAAGGRFVTEFGIQAAPAVETLRAWSAGDRNRSPDGERVMRAFTERNVGAADDPEAFAYLTQLNQAEALVAAITAWRCDYRGPGRDANAGVLIWQINDCWPVVSWSLVDYALRPKHAYYAVARAFAPISVALNSTTTGVDLVGLNTTPAEVAGTVRLTRWSAHGELIATETRQALLAPNRSADLGWAAPPPGRDEVIAAVLDVGGTQVARASVWPQPHVQAVRFTPTITATRGDSGCLTLRTDRPVKGLVLDLLEPSDNLIDLMPGEPQTVHARALSDGPIGARWLGSPGVVHLTAAATT